MGYVCTNVDRATIASLDLSLDRRFRDWLAVSGNLAYVHGTNHSPVQVCEDDEHNLTFAPIVSSEPLPGIYPLRGTVWLRLVDPRCERWSVQVGARMVRNQDRVAFTLSELPTPGFSVFDVSGYYAVTDHFRINLAVENLLDRQYTEHGSLVLVNRAGQAVFVKEPGINVFLGAELTY